ncbi:MAG: formate--tetrahydrofolate ligase, partial [Ruthenibacterium sp.]
MKSDIQIAQEAVMQPVCEIADALGLAQDTLIPYGRYKAKVDHRLVKQPRTKPAGKVILLTAISPTPAGEGK